MSNFTPRLPASDYKTYQILQPKATHWRKATCEEIRCAAGENGWRSVIDESTELGQRQAYYIRKQSGRKFSEEKLPNGLTQFSFPSGQNCFADHQERIEDRPELYFVKGGDKRGNPRGTPTRQHTKAEFWVEDFQENQDKLRSHIEKG
jgi:hypothetical protein